MYQNTKRPVNPEQPYRPVFQGAFERFVMVGGKKRRYLVYVPEGARESTAGLFVLGENNRTADELWLEGAWRHIADTEECKEKLIVVFLEPEAGVWNVDEDYGTPNGDVAYVNAVQQAAAERLLFCIHESKNYLCGIREGGTIAHMAAMSEPAVYAGLASLGGNRVTNAYMAACANDFCTNLDGYMDRTARQGRKKKDIPLPVWVLDDPAVPDSGSGAVVDYWKRACGVEERAGQIMPDTVEFIRERPTEYPVNQEKTAYRVWQSKIAGVSEDNGMMVMRRVWKDFLYRQRRWMADPGGDLRITQDPVRDLGMEYHYENIDGWMREWYVFVPDCVKKQPTQAVPLVIAMHGYTCSGEIYAGNSEWYKVAQDRGFIVIHPTAVYGQIEITNQACDPANAPLPAWNFLHETPNGPDDMAFIRTIIEKAAESHLIDRSRVYVTGHSHGSMMAQALALAAPELFAAAAPCSGVLFGGIGDKLLSQPEIQNRPDESVPIWMFVGEQESWLLPHLPTADNDSGATINLWRKNNGLEPERLQDFSEGWSVYADRWHDLSYCDAHGIPLVKFTWVDYMPHATMPEMSYRIWDEFFMHFSKKNGAVRYK